MTEEQIAALRVRAAPILDADDPFEVISDELQRWWGGDPIPVKTLYLGATSRLLPKGSATLPCHTQVLGPAGMGKSYALECVLKLFPPEDSPESVHLEHEATSPACVCP